jgi:hypothetical protein
MNHIGQWIAVFLTISDHSSDIIPWITIILHSFNYFNDCINISIIFLNVFSFKFLNVLLLLKLFYSFILIFFNLIILFPSNLFKLFFLLMLGFFIMQEILIDRFVKCCKFYTFLLCIFNIFIWRKFKIVSLFDFTLF